ncbi:BirA family transcriptional regulator, biotin operon repressor / biotin-[acetyl-CoA-carboxylase] ligase [Rubritalea squalenifaciens DSM 18772]|uniref:BirA family transcriptional regulator, biotin operon repressor / biotin-[acetyl-CoA-carboxylase] ligase n=1 Tax=Rubritalea squalenifaciens DSM 18772 TaxID=1123071 RepID=A0A1M6LGW3_9BACT|nr:biotin--[acetyl-CoA-carboxylase] ligase [Rubritalea squalenifaciens]SHJ70434.1 BirA family transcriptional regulator, biotin operon repressor / biotin-[acetyl-CoA-carboxylase] ligase [Rubritalea squalenifaciens DSM 18772]
MFDRELFYTKIPALNGLLEYAEVMESTSDRALELGQAGSPSGTLVMAERQTKGRGRRGSRWACPEGEGLLFSLVLDPDVGKELWSRFALVAGLAVAEVIEGFGLEAGIKWPNDVWIGEKKCAGILVEGAADRLVIGIGLNVSVRSFPAELEATSLLLEGVPKPSREEILAGVVQGIFRWGSLVGGGYEKVIAEVQKRLVFRNQLVRMLWQGEPCEGVVRGLNDEGHLLVEMNGVVQAVVQADEIRSVQS